MNRKRSFLLTLIICLAACNGINVDPDLTLAFIKFFGGTEADHVAEVQVTGDNEYVLVGTTASATNGGTDIIVVKTDIEGNKLWEKRYGGTLSDSGFSIKQTSDKGFIVLGSVGKSDATSSMYLLKISSEGDTLWSKTIGYKTSGAYVEVTSNGGFIAIGNSDSTGSRKVFLHRTDNNGNKVFRIEPTGFNNNNTYATSVKEVNDTIFDWVGVSVTTPLIARNRKSGAGVLFAYLKDQDFISELSMVTYNGMYKAADGGYIMVGTCINNNDKNAFLLKLSGDIYQNPVKDWFKTFGANKSEEGFSVVQTSDGGYILTGYTESYGNGDKDIYIVKTNASGDEEWHKTYGGPSSDIGKSIKQTSDGGYLLVGDFSLITTPSNNSVITLIKTDENGDIKNTK